MRILLAEDDELLGSGIRAGLAQNGFQVQSYSGGIKGNLDPRSPAKLPTA